MLKENRTTYEIKVDGLWPFQVCVAKHALTDAGFQCLSCTSQTLSVDIDNEHLMVKGLEFGGPREYVVDLLKDAAHEPKWGKLVKHI